MMRDIAKSCLATIAIGLTLGAAPSIDSPHGDGPFNPVAHLDQSQVIDRVTPGN